MRVRCVVLYVSDVNERPVATGPPWSEKLNNRSDVASVHEVESVPRVFRLDPIPRAMIEAAVEEKTKHHEIFRFARYP